MTTYRFAFVISKYFEFGGLERSMLRMAKEALKRGHTVDLFTWNWVGEKPEGLTVHRFKNNAWLNHNKNNQLADWISAAEMKNSYDCLVGFRKIPGLDIYYAADPCYAEILESQKSKLFQWFPRARHLKAQEAGVFQKGLSTEILLIAHKEKEFFINHYGTEEHRFHQLPSGINKNLSKKPEDSELDSLKNELNIQPGEKILLHIGSDFKRKGLDRALRALASLPDSVRKSSRLIVVGESCATKYRFLAKWLGVSEQVTFVGARKDIAKFYYISDLLIHPAYVENTGNVILEALYCGVPALVTESCGFSTHVAQAEAGLVSPEPFDQKSLNRQLYEMLTTKKEVWGENGKRFCDTHDIFSLIPKAVDIMEKRAKENLVNRSNSPKVGS